MIDIVIVVSIIIYLFMPKTHALSRPLHGHGLDRLEPMCGQTLVNPTLRYCEANMHACVCVCVCVCPCARESNYTW
jgi:hypothetical protein